MPRLTTKRNRISPQDSQPSRLSAREISTLIALHTQSDLDSLIDKAIAQGQMRDIPPELQSTLAYLRARKKTVA